MALYFGCETFEKMEAFKEWTKSQSSLSLVEHAIVAGVVVYTVRKVYRTGVKKAIGSFVVSLARSVPGVDGKIQAEIDQEVEGALATMFKSGSAAVPEREALPKVGRDSSDIYKELETIAKSEARTDNGECFAYVYEVGKKHSDVLLKAHTIFGHENGLSPMAFPGLRKFEVEVVAMAAKMLNGDKNCSGTMSTGGTESIFLAMKAYRDRAQSLYPHITEPEVVAPLTVHPAFTKAAHILRVKLVYVEESNAEEGYRVDMKAFEKAITSNTILLVGSAPAYPYGVIDPIVEMGQLAEKNKLPLHVDACIGGFMLPWVEKLGYEMPLWDFRVPAVTSISADVHKYGYGAKGASVIVYRNSDFRKYQFFTYAGWPGGLMGSSTFLGTRPGGPIAAAWAGMNALGESGYVDLMKGIMEAVTKLKKGINNIDGLFVIGKPNGSLISFTSRDSNILIIADLMDKRGWRMERQQPPASIHMTVMPQHIPVVDKLLKDLKECTAEAKTRPDLAKEGTAGMYGMVATIPDMSLVDKFLTSFLDKTYTMKSA